MLLVLHAGRAALRTGTAEEKEVRQSIRNRPIHRHACGAPVRSVEEKPHQAKRLACLVQRGAVHATLEALHLIFGRDRVPPPTETVVTRSASCEHPCAIHEQ